VLARDVREPDEVQLLSLTKGTQADDIVAIVGQKSGETTTKALINARLGQGRFRTDVMRYWGNACAVTGSKVTDAIRASHIKPWRDADVNTERLDPFNGLPLIASLDALFDKGLITFDEGGKLLISKQLKKSEHVIFGLAGKSLQKNLPEKTLKYLKYHRDYIFRG
jgi:predicted restriction endonuclease